MKLELDCSWNDKKNRAKQSIHFDYRPKSIFMMPDDKISLIQKLSQTARAKEPSAIKNIEELVKQFPKSLYALVNYYKVLQFFEFLDESRQVFSNIEKRFPREVFTRCIIGKFLLSSKRYQEFSQIFNRIEVLKGAFPERRMFFFEEALFFHNLWGLYWFEIGDEIQSEKHKRLFLFIMNTLQNFQLAAVSN